MYDPRLSKIMTGAIRRIQADMTRAAPAMAGQVWPWITALAGTAPPEDYFKHPLAFPALLFPWWLEETIRPDVDLAFQAGLAYSTVNGYYYIRLIDNLMDGEATVELKLLPALNFFHTHFQSPYQQYFAGGHPFWQAFTTIWLHSAEAALQDAYLTGVDLRQFQEVAAQKVSAAKIPVVAVCYRYERPDLIPTWSKLLERFGAWHQMLNDLFDWQRDLNRGAQTYFLSEARRRGREAGDGLAAWVIEEGFTWGLKTLYDWLEELRTLAGRCSSPALLAYLAEREAMLRAQEQEVSAGLQQMVKLLALGRKAGAS